MYFVSFTKIFCTGRKKEVRKSSVWAHDMVYWPLKVFEMGTNIDMELHSFENFLEYALALEPKDSLRSVGAYHYSRQFSKRLKHSGFKWFTLRPTDLVGQNSMFSPSWIQWQLQERSHRRAARRSPVDPRSWEIVLHCCVKPLRLGVFGYAEQKWQPGVCWPRSDLSGLAGMEWSGVQRARGTAWSQGLWTTLSGALLWREQRHGGRAEAGLGKNWGVSLSYSM